MGIREKRTHECTADVTPAPPLPCLASLPPPSWFGSAGDHRGPTSRLPRAQFLQVDSAGSAWVFIRGRRTDLPSWGCESANEAREHTFCAAPRSSGRYFWSAATTTVLSCDKVGPGGQRVECTTNGAKECNGCHPLWSVFNVARRTCLARESKTSFFRHTHLLVLRRLFPALFYHAAGQNTQKTQPAPRGWRKA